jgi:hypothetical protein
LSLQDSDDNATDFQVTTPSAPQSVVLWATPASVDFGSVPQLTSQSQSVSIKNLLLISIALDTPGIAGNDAADFAADAPSATTLAGGASATVNITFHPSVTGSRTAALGVTSSNGGSAIVSLAGVSTPDTTVPTLTLPGGITMEATGATTVVTYTASATDAVDGPIVPDCSPSSASAFPVGTTTVNCTATDPHGNSSTGGFSLTVTDHTAPAITVPANITTPATTTTGAVVTFTASAADLVDGTRPVSCVPVSGSTFAVGSTTVTCSATDLRGNTASASFTVLVTPKNPKAPKVTAPKNMRVEATGPTGAIVTFVATAMDPFDGPLPVTCSPASGSPFPLGSTLVTCSATNSSGKTDTDTFTVTVRDSTGRSPVR